MSIVAAGTIISNFLPVDPSDTEETTTSRLSPHCTSGISKQGSTNIYLPTFTVQSTLWVSMYMWVGGTGGGDMIVFRKDGNNIARVLSVSSSFDVILQIYNGATWDTVASTHFFSVGVLTRLDAKLVIHDTTGEFVLYANGVQVLSYTSGDTLRNGQSDCNQVGVGKFGSCSVSGVFVSTADSRNIDMQQLIPTSVGNYTAWTGTYTDVDDTGVPDGLFIESGTADQLETYGKTSLDTAFNSGYNLIALGVSARALRGTGGPQNLQMVVRSGTTDGVSSTQSLEVTYEPRFAEFANDPDTASAWGFSAMDSAEIGVKSIT